LGVTLDLKEVKLIAEFTEAITDRKTYARPDGSQTNW